ncbi:MAG: 6-carboxytetrahydropterin synthase QueD [Candidatus Omnitrophota bacterium]|nr:MAG: 6-carboxytetrahydropterin synthase QueD [Candidatus Omnitrophota bacterium]
MYEIKTISYFSAAHSLRDYKGKCECLHGHNWKVEVLVSSPHLNPAGMVMDFGELRKVVGDILEELDHKYLNDLDYFKEKNPSSEEIARHIFEKLKGKISERNCRLTEVRVWETQNSCAIYAGDKYRRLVK